MRNQLRASDFENKTLSDKVEILARNIERGDFIVFGFNYYGGEPNEIIVSNITEIYKGTIITHFLYGYRGLSEDVPFDKILAIGSKYGKDEIKGWSGNFIIIQKDKLELINT